MTMKSDWGKGVLSDILINLCVWGSGAHLLIPLHVRELLSGDENPLQPLSKRAATLPILGILATGSEPNFNAHQFALRIARHHWSSSLK